MVVRLKTGLITIPVILANVLPAEARHEMPHAGRYAAEGLFTVIASHQADATQPTILHRRDLPFQFPRS